MATLIKNGLLIDGTGHPPLKADVLFRGEIIEKIGNIPTREGRVVIDARGGFVFPGLVDVGVMMDDYEALFSDRHSAALLRRGITTLIGGTYGESLAPFSAACVNKKLHFRCTHPASRDWEHQGEFLGFVERYRPPMNFGTLVGYHTVRNCIVKNMDGDPTRDELIAIERSVKESLEAGAFGISFDMKSSHTSLMPKRTFSELAGLTGRYGGVLSLTAEDNVSASDTFLDAYALSERRGVSVEIGRLSVETGEEMEEFIKTLAKLERKRSVVAVHFDVAVIGSAREEAFVKLLPSWAREKSLDMILPFLRRSSHRARLVTHFKKIIPQEALVGEVPSNLSFLRGKKLSAVGENHGIGPAEALIRIMELSGLRGSCLFPGVINPGFLVTALHSPFSVLSSHCLSPQDDVPSLLEIAEQLNISFETLIMKHTLRPAKKFRIAKRGLIKEGYFADVVVLGTDGYPERVFVNGNATYVKGAMMPLRAGHALRIGKG